MKDCYDKDKCLVIRDGKAQLPCLYSWGMKGDTCIIKAEVTVEDKDQQVLKV